MSAYDPISAASRFELGAAILAALDSWGFTEITAQPGERVFGRAAGPGLECRVYTTIVGGSVRAVGKDAIRISLVYIAGEQHRGVGKQRAVHRVGQISAIIKRIKQRIDNATNGLEICERCGAPKFKARSGRMVCAALCWTREPAPNRTGAQVDRNDRKDRIENRHADVEEPKALATPVDKPASAPREYAPMGRRKAGAPKGRSW